MDRLEGTVILKSSRNLRVDTAEGVLVCSLRGRFRTVDEGGAPAVVGDRVVVSRVDAAEGVLERVLARRTELWRATAGGRPVLVAANVERILVVLAAKDPPPRWALVDRMLVAAERDSIEPAVCLNKWDQVRDSPAVAEELERVLGLYRSLGYPAFSSSALEGQGVDAIRDWLREKATVLSGHSGVGKSTILNQLHPCFDLPTCDVNPVTGKGRHMTTAVRFLKLPFGGYAVDTPGFREFQPVDLPRPELGRHYREFLEHVRLCRFKDCLHHSEPDCAVRRAVEGGRISKMRYNNYLQILSSLGAETQGH